MNILDMSATKIGLEIKNKNISCTEILDVFFENCKNENNAYITLTKDYAYEKAKEIQNQIDKGINLSPLAGVPVSIKDNICTKNILTTSSSKMLKDYVPKYNATVFERLEQAGAILVGKLNLDEFAMGDTGATSFYGKCKNPWNIEKTTGGSSSGCASSLAYGEAIYTLGSDTGGSARQPASFCNLTAIKPTYGVVSRYGLIGFAPNFDQIAPMTKDAIDCLNVMKIISGFDEKDEISLDCKFNIDENFDFSNLKIGICKNFIDYSDNDVQKAILNGIEIFKKKGCYVEEIDFDILDYSTPTYQILSSVLAVSNMARYVGYKNDEKSLQNISYEQLCIDNRTDCFGKEVKKRIMYGNYILKNQKYYEMALKSKDYICKQYNENLEKYDILIMPTTPKTAISYEDKANTDIFLMGANISGVPSITIPCGFDKNNMPIGMQIVSSRLKDELLLNIAIAFQKETDFHLKKAKI